MTCQRPQSRGNPRTRKKFTLAALMLNENYEKDGCVDSVEFMMEEKVVKPRAKSSSSAKPAEVKKHFLKKTT